jgi:hypothetical protein
LRQSLPQLTSASTLQQYTSPCSGPLVSSSHERSGSIALNEPVYIYTGSTEYETTSNAHCIAPVDRQVAPRVPLRHSRPQRVDPLLKIHMRRSPASNEPRCLESADLACLVLSLHNRIHTHTHTHTRPDSAHKAFFPSSLKSFPIHLPGPWLHNTSSSL